MGPHPSHKTRISMDASTYDEICDICGATDELGGWGLLSRPCPGPRTPMTLETMPAGMPLSPPSCPLAMEELAEKPEPTERDFEHAVEHYEDVYLDQPFSAYDDRDAADDELVATAKQKLRVAKKVGLDAAVGRLRLYLKGEETDRVWPGRPEYVDQLDWMSQQIEKDLRAVLASFTETTDASANSGSTPTSQGDDVRADAGPGDGGRQPASR